MVQVMVTIDTEEDDWGSYDADGARVRNIAYLPDAHELFQRYGARPTFFVNRPPLLDSASLEVLSCLASDPAAEIAAHCHPWNTPPLEGPAGEDGSMMCNLSRETNRGKVAEITRLLDERLGVRPVSFRAGRWAFGPTVAGALHDLGYEVDSSVAPFVNWRRQGGPDFTGAQLEPYRFDPDEPLVPRSDGSLVEVPATVGSLKGSPGSQSRTRARLEEIELARHGLVGTLDRAGLFARRWLSPEVTRAADLIRLSENLVRHGTRTLGLTFHSCTLLPGATPFVRTQGDRVAFLAGIEGFLAHARDRGWTFSTVAEVAASVEPRAA